MLSGRKKRTSLVKAAIRSPVVTTLRWSVAVLLPLWLVYFFAVTVFAKTLNAIMVPQLNMPLGDLMVIQGAALAFLAILVPLKRAFSAATP